MDKLLRGQAAVNAARNFSDVIRLDKDADPFEIALNDLDPEGEHVEVILEEYPDVLFASWRVGGQEPVKTGFDLEDAVRSVRDDIVRDVAEQVSVFLDEHPHDLSHDDLDVIREAMEDDSNATAEEIAKVVQKARATDLCAEASAIDPSIDDGSGTLRIIVDQALADDPDVTALDIVEIVLQARRDWSDELSHEARSGP